MYKLKLPREFSEQRMNLPFLNLIMRLCYSDC